MPVTSPTPRNALQVVLFGLPSAGKSSLLGALAKANQNQADMLGAKLDDKTGVLAPLLKSTYANQPMRTKEEIVFYPVHVEMPEVGVRDFVLIDCDGKVAEAYVVNRRPLDDKGPLARALLGADAVVFAADASLPKDRLQENFKHFHQFLTLLESTRGANTDLAGLPVFLVLTKSDLLADEGASLPRWVETLEEKKRAVGQEFREFLARQQQPTSFGEIEMRIHATAVKRPAFSQPNQAKDLPFGVAELFRQTLVEAVEYRENRRLSAQQLGFAVLGMFALVGFLGFLAFWMLTRQADPAIKRLEDALRQAVPNMNAPPPERLRGALDARVRQLRSLQSDPDYDKLPSARRDEVRGLLEEMEAYRQAQQKLQDSVKLPYLAKDEKELVGFETSLKEFAFPETYKETWKETRLAKRAEILREEYAALRGNLVEETAWLQGRIREGKGLIIQGNKLDNKILAGEKLSSTEYAGWTSDLDAFLAHPGRLHPDQNLIGVSKFTYENLGMFASIRQQHKDWDELKANLREVYNKLEKRKG